MKSPMIKMHDSGGKKKVKVCKKSGRFKLGLTKEEHVHFGLSYTTCYLFYLFNALLLGR